MFCETDIAKREIVELISFAVHHEKGNRLKEACYLYGLAGAKAYQLSNDPLDISEMGEMKTLATNLFNRMLKMIKTNPEEILPEEIGTISFDFGSNGTQLISAAKTLFAMSKQKEASGYLDIALLYSVEAAFKLYQAQLCGERVPQNKHEEITLYKDVRKSIVALQKRRQYQSSSSSIKTIKTTSKNCCSSPSFNTHSRHAEQELWEILESAQRLDITNAHAADLKITMSNSDEAIGDTFAKSVTRGRNYKLGLRKGEQYFDPLAKQSLSRILKLHQ